MVSQIESTAGLGNELGELEFFAMDQPATTRAASKNLLKADDVDALEPEEEYLDDADLDADRGRKNSLF